VIVYSYSHIGKKNNNEDALRYNKWCLLVCDGVGGGVKGELASKEVSNYILQNFDHEPLNELRLIALARKAQSRLNNLVSKEPSLEGMATTIAAIFLTKTGLFTMHAGDSRVFFVKSKKKKFWQTWDHSIVSSLVKNGEITREQARKHPLNNQINRAFIGNSENSTIEPEIHLISDIEEGDICFICSDGVLEAFSDYELLSLLSEEKLNLNQKLVHIQQRCKKESRDNHSAIIALFEKKDINFFSHYPTNWSLIDYLATS
jgi:protein phosphatase|tara:strand:- start:2179 stop:2958 length:780 start_codon:yes stop_codon:yes gene_type:complete